MREFSLLLRPAPDVKGQWTCHCLNWDLVTQGDSPSHAFEMVAEAIVFAIQEDLEAGIDPAERPPAPPEIWEIFSRTQQRGTRIAPADIDTVLTEQSVLAAILYLAHKEERIELPRVPLDAPVPPPFVIAALQDGESEAHRRR